MMVRLFTGGYLHCWGCLCLGRGNGQVGSSFLLVFNQALTVKYSVFNKTQIKNLNNFITINQLGNYFWRKHQISWQDFRLKKNFTLFVACKDFRLKKNFTLFMACKD